MVFHGCWNARTMRLLNRPGVRADLYSWPKVAVVADELLQAGKGMAAVSKYRVGVLGHGAIGSVVAEQLSLGAILGAQLEGVILRRPRPDLDVKQLSLNEAMDRCDLIVECAGQQALHDHAVPILQAGVDLLISSMGALADQQFAQQLQDAGPGRLSVTSGAIGGLDLLAAAARMGGI